MIVDEGRSYRIERTDTGDTLVVTDSWNEGISQILAFGRVDGLDLNYAKGFKDSDLSMLQDWPLKRLTVLARTAKDLSPVLRLYATLEELSVQTAPSAVIDLGRFPVLRVLAAGWRQVRSTIAEAPLLSDLMVREYHEGDLSPLRWNASLTRLRFKDHPRISKLSGVEFLRSLRHLAVYLAPLHDLDALATNDVALHELHVESCAVGDLSPLASQRSLRLLNASECGDLASLDPLREMSDLSTLWLFGTTRVLDNDLSPLSELPRLRELRMRSRRSYHPSVEIIQALCAARATD